MTNSRTHRINEFDKNLLELLIKEYKEHNLSLRKIQEKYNVNRKKLSKVFEELGVKTTKGNHYRTYFHDFDYFEIINSHEKAYWLGFMMADGYIQQNKNTKRYGEDKFGITLSSKDIETLYKFKEAIKATNPISIYQETRIWDNDKYEEPFESEACRIIMTSQKTSNDLIDKGVVYKKSLIKRFPKEEKLPKKYFYSYLRGYLDGNGSILIKEYKTKRNEFSLSFATCLSFAEDLKSIIGGTICMDKRCDNRVCTLRFSHEQSRVILHKIYENSTPQTRLERKYKVYINNL